jgi:hypothetical protein
LPFGFEKGQGGEMKYRCVVSILATSIFAFSITYAKPSEQAYNFLKTKIAEIKGENKLPSGSSQTLVPKCGTPVMAAAFATFRATGDERIQALFDRPDSVPLILQSQHFTVHYTTSGVDAPFEVDMDVNPADGVPDYINRVSEIFEHVWRIEIDSMGFLRPPSDHIQGGDSTFDIYIKNLGQGLFGYTQPESVVFSYRAFSYIVLENDFAESPVYNSRPLDAVRVTAAHEFFHAIQFAYDAFEFDSTNPNDPNTYKPWWLEASSTWMEDVVYTDVNDYIGYLPFFYGYIWMGLGTFSYGRDARAFHPYASCVWPIYLSKKFNSLGIMKEIWEGCGATQGYNTLTATNAVLSSHGSNLAQAFLEFEIWNFHTGGRADTINYYTEGRNFPEADLTAFVDDLNINSTFDFPDGVHFPEHLGANYLVAQVIPSTPGGVIANFDGLDVTSVEWHAALLGYKTADSRWVDIQANPSTGVGAGAWPGWSNYRDVVLVPTVSGLAANYSSYRYSGSFVYDPTLESGGNPKFGLESAYPSPYIITANDKVTIPYALDKSYSKKDLGLSIFDASGALVCKIPGEDFLFTDPGEYHRGVQWDGKNEKGEYVASGIYLILFHAQGHSASGKIALINKTR